MRNVVSTLYKGTGVVAVGGPLEDLSEKGDDVGRGMNLPGFIYMFQASIRASDQISQLPNTTTTFHMNPEKSRPIWNHRHNQSQTVTHLLISHATATCLKTWITFGTLRPTPPTL